MSVLIKRTENGHNMEAECVYGCCTPVYGKNTRKVRRHLKRRDKQHFRRELAGSEY